jgi:hypothetical protein
MILKGALIAFLVIGVATIVLVFIRKSRANGFPTPESSSHFWQSEGAMPPTPKPTWLESGSDDADGERRQT